MTSTIIPRPDGVTLIPPQLPGYLSAIHDLKPIVGTPTNQEIKAIHNVIRSLNAAVHLPTLYDSDLSMRLSQHLFGAQLSVYRTNYSMALLPGEKSTYTPPTLPWHITDTLNKVIGTPSDEEIKSVQNIIRSIENLANNPQLFDEDLSMKLSQHMFNIQFARYMHDSAQGGFVPNQELLRRTAPVPQSEPNNPPIPVSEHSPEAPSELTQLGEVMEEIKGTLNESKDILVNMNRVLISTQRNQSTIAYYQNPTNSTMHVNPVNQQGKLASECGLPQLRYYCTHGNSYSLWMKPHEIAGYLGFYNIGDGLLQSGNEPKLKDGKEDEAKQLLLKHIGLHYS
ncbi:hypothetical protein OPQ81_010488 [Rhizoctonia solani]|nr:hypothetical protein OPQ81_010488 [Rhizoctonia solani]